MLFVNNMPVRWVSKRQKTVETSTYGSELVAARIAVDLIVEMRYVLRMLGVKVEKQTLLLGDNNSVVLNTTLPSSILKKKHNAIAYHRVREAVAAGIVRFAYVKSSDNLADLLTKSLGKAAFYKLTKECLFRVPGNTMKPGHNKAQADGDTAGEAERGKGGEKGELMEKVETKVLRTHAEVEDVTGERGVTTSFTHRKSSQCDSRVSPQPREGVG